MRRLSLFLKSCWLNIQGYISEDVDNHEKGRPTLPLLTVRCTCLRNAGFQISICVTQLILRWRSCASQFVILPRRQTARQMIFLPLWKLCFPFSGNASFERSGRLDDNAFESFYFTNWKKENKELKPSVRLYSIWWWFLVWPLMVSVPLEYIWNAVIQTRLRHKPLKQRNYRTWCSVWLERL